MSDKRVASAARALVVQSLDILIGASYILVDSTLLLLFLRSRRLGSNFALHLPPFSLFSPSSRHALPQLPVVFTEAPSFLVCTVGRDQPMGCWNSSEENL
ncbi:3-hydroxy-3-methylglutaryl-coenzyme A (HMG-CoA) reductase isozyme [Stygiomarasmius scandens]|uniref:3-hydroxy-3-methylglutaryl-coenzyme A (HMG-CoA) reductase isozyme n=1 Tax=Marasmiellus scandens TaxID=2682957 RepID=A0ABR1IXU4_9AGAR